MNDLFSAQTLFTVITTGALYKAFEKLFDLLCQKWFKEPISAQLCLICFVICYFIAAAITAAITGAFK